MTAQGLVTILRDFSRVHGVALLSIAAPVAVVAAALTVEQALAQLFGQSDMTVADSPASELPVSATR
jgi:hypothetical protein